MLSRQIDTQEQSSLNTTLRHLRAAFPCSLYRRRLACSFAELKSNPKHFGKLLGLGQVEEVIPVCRLLQDSPNCCFCFVAQETPALSFTSVIAIGACQRRAPLEQARLHRSPHLPW